ncbi:TIM44-like domain-containing protein [Plastoroseomonas arctica]|uniref:TIM44-like domain-containing protein n=1 Tax=Plastoroseomonas arctica TaxID=1509237 RepID=A0AAF1K2A5_9PROT|nr:TIM44-like domain-containing protein [Plastoroseomonas arctica]MBR0655221.1 TIM44-like domain-containing protein [Plastoroseomonas arctica]
MPRNRPALLAAALAAGLMALAPTLADARVGGGSSSGSRGSRTQSAPAPTQTAPSAAQPMQRTQQPSNPSVGSTAPAAAGAAAAARPSASRGFMGGLMGGLLGAGLIGVLFGAGLMGGLGGFASILGLLFQVALVVGVIWLVMRLFRGRRQQPAYAAAGVGDGATGYARQAQMPMSGSAGPATVATMPFNPTPADFQAFEQLLKGVNAAWSARDMASLNRLATPEMVGYFNDDYAALDARGWRNETRDLTFDQGDLSEAWNEGGRDYASVAMKFSMVDVTRRVADNAVVEGDPNRRTTATEIWTFVRPRGAAWQLSAIQQAA